MVVVEVELLLVAVAVAVEEEVAVVPCQGLIPADHHRPHPTRA